MLPNESKKADTSAKTVTFMQQNNAIALVMILAFVHKDEETKFPFRFSVFYKKKLSHVLGILTISNVLPPEGHPLSLAERLRYEYLQTRFTSLCRDHHDEDHDHRDDHHDRHHDDV